MSGRDPDKVREVQERVRRYLDRYGWDIVEGEESWREYQKRRTAEAYGEDEW
jgi:hypothetical protein